jgi:tripartite-type tricarboxylate transporter receptor subunit TctC
MPITRFITSAGAALLGFAALAAATPPVFAQGGYPARPITIILPFGAGGSGDKFIRVMGPRIEKMLGQPLIVESRAGGGTNIGTDYVVRSRPDGYTLLLAGVPLAVNPYLYKKLSWSLDDLVPVNLISTSPYVMVVNKELPVKSFKDFLQYAREHPDKANYSSSGAGSGAHMAGALINQMAGTKINHIPYTSAPQSLTDVIGGSVQMTFSPLVSSVPMIESGRVRALAVTGLKRSSSLPDVPTVAESGLPGFEMISWYGILAPRGTPPEVVKKLNTAFYDAMKDPEVVRLLSTDGIELTPGTPGDFAKFLKRTAATAAEVVKSSGAIAD